jgi:hypothetical protein
MAFNAALSSEHARNVATYRGADSDFASGGIIMASAASLKIFVAHGGIIHPETAKLTMLD